MAKYPPTHTVLRFPDRTPRLTLPSHGKIHSLHVVILCVRAYVWCAYVWCGYVWCANLQLRQISDGGRKRGQEVVREQKLLEPMQLADVLILECVREKGERRERDRDIDIELYIRTNRHTHSTVTTIFRSHVHTHVLDGVPAQIEDIQREQLKERGSREQRGGRVDSREKDGEQREGGRAESREKENVDRC